jgi:hypothetical protein
MNQGEPSRVVVKRGERLRLHFGVLQHASAMEQGVNLPPVDHDFVSQN